MSLFETSILGAKMTLALLLFILSFINAYTPFITKSPRKFLGEMVLVGAMSALSFGFVGGVRGVPGLRLVSFMFMAFLVFSLFHVVMEFSGGNQVSVNAANADGKIQKEKKVLTSQASLTVLAIIALVILGLALSVRDFEYVTASQLLFEATVFAFLNAIPTIMISVDRGERKPVKIIIDFMKMFGLFFVGHFVLQSGGFYTTVFSDT
jgi:hypothetical protein